MAMFCLTREGNSCHVRNFLVGDYNQLCISEYQSGKSHLRVCGLFTLVHFSVWVFSFTNAIYVYLVRY